MNIKADGKENRGQVSGISQKNNTMIQPQKVLLIGTMGSGKTTVAERLARDAGFSYASIDDCRLQYGDGTMAGEICAWDHFLAMCENASPAVLEFSGCGPHTGEVRDALLKSGIPVTVIWLVFPTHTCILRALQRNKDIPAPYDWAPLEYAIPAFHDAIEESWERSWKREPAFHVIRQVFSGAMSAEEVYPVIRKICSTCSD